MTALRSNDLPAHFASGALAAAARWAVGGGADATAPIAKASCLDGHGKYE